MYAADAPRAAPRFRRVTDVDDAGGAAETEAGPAAFGRELLDAEDRRQELLRRRRVALPDLGAAQAADLLRDRHIAGRPRRERSSRGRFDERDVQAVRIREPEHLLTEARVHGSRLRSIAQQTWSPLVEAALRHFE